MRFYFQLLAFGAAVGFGAIAQAAPPAEPVENILCRGTSAEGFSYWWGGECWCASGCTPDLTSCAAGDCSGSCPGCTHSGTYGADCSGFVSKAWQVPDPYPVDACGTDRFVAESFTNDHAYWDPVSLGSLQPGDAAATSSHVILIIGPRDGSGEHEVVEAMGCSYGIVRHSRSVASFSAGARRVNLTACVCAEGDSETEECGDCGSRTRACSDGCSWSAWSACDGPDPAEPGACTIDGATGVCAQGEQHCVAGWLTCQAELAATEVCDGEDNDCDGVVDNGTDESLGEGYPCINACGEGVSACIEGGLRCVTPGTSWPDDSCNPGAGASGPGGEGPGGGPVSGVSSDDEGGCSCRMGGRPRPLPVAAALLLLGVVARRRRHS